MTQLDLLSRTTLELVKGIKKSHVILTEETSLLSELAAHVDPQCTDESGQPLLALIASLSFGPKASGAVAPARLARSLDEALNTHTWPHEQEQAMNILVARGANPFDHWSDAEKGRKCAFMTAVRRDLNDWVLAALHHPRSPKGDEWKDLCLDPPLLHQVTALDNITLVKALLKKGYPVDHSDANGSTALFYAKTPEIAQILMQAGSSPYHTNNDGSSLADAWARVPTQTREALLDVLKNDPAHHQVIALASGQAALLAALSKGQTKTIKILLDEGVHHPSAMAAACGCALGTSPNTSVQLGGILSLLQSDPFWKTSPLDREMIHLTLSVFGREMGTRGEQQAEKIKAILGARLSEPLQGDFLDAWVSKMSPLVKPSSYEVARMWHWLSKIFEKPLSVPLTGSFLAAAAEVFALGNDYHQTLTYVPTGMNTSGLSEKMAAVSPNGAKLEDHSDPALVLLIFNLFKYVWNSDLESIDELPGHLGSWLNEMKQVITMRPQLLKSPCLNNIHTEAQNDGMAGTLAREWIQAALHGDMTHPSAAPSHRLRM